MDLYARLNILGGHSVRLPHGDISEAIRLDNDPILRARGWAEQGADYIHVVDLDAAAHRDYQNRPLIDEMIKELPIPVQVAGGVRTPGEVTRLIEAGAHRVVMGTAAIEDQNLVWDLCREHPDRIVVSIDVRPDQEIAIRGWTLNSGRYLEEVLLGMSDAGVTSFLIAEAARNALLEPPNLSILATALSLVDDDVIAAGGVRHLDDLRDVIAMQSGGKRVSGVIVGREVTHGRFTLDEAKTLLATTPEATADDNQPSTPAPDPAVAKAAQRYLAAAAEFERAASHARTAARRLLAGEVSRGHVHGMTAIGHAGKADEQLQEVTSALADKSNL